MITVINDKELGKVEIVTQQYQVGLYVAIYKNKRLINQFGSNLKEVAYHRKVRIRAIKRGDTIVDGTMDCPISYMCYSTKDKPYFKLRHNGK